MILGERLFELFKIQFIVVDSFGVVFLQESIGYIKWENVGFLYDNCRIVFYDLLFECKFGMIIVFVGEFGGGKLIVFWFMFWYYNFKVGRFLIEGQDV